MLTAIRDSLLSALPPRHIVMASLDSSLKTLQELFTEHQIHHVLIVEQHKLVGVVSDRDLLRNISLFIGNELNERGQDLATLNRKAHQIMSRHLVTASITTTVEQAINLMLTHGVSCLPIVDERMKPVSLITWRDLLRLFVPAPEPVISEISEALPVG